MGFFTVFRGARRIASPYTREFLPSRRPRRAILPVPTARTLARRNPLILSACILVRLHPRRTYVRRAYRCAAAPAPRETSTSHARLFTYASVQRCTCTVRDAAVQSCKDTLAFLSPPSAALRRVTAVVVSVLHALIFDATGILMLHPGRAQRYER